jgi:hypothetical protein
MIINGAPAGLVQTPSLWQSTPWARVASRYASRRLRGG